MVKRRTLLASAAAGLAVPRTARADATPTPDIPYFEGIAKLDNLPLGWGAGINRFVLEPGQVWNWVYPGPVTVTVDAGIMTIENELLARHTHGNNQGGSIASGGGLSNEIQPRSGVSSADGNLGPLRNGGTEPLVIFIMNAVPPQEFESEVDSESATPVST